MSAVCPVCHCYTPDSNFPDMHNVGCTRLTAGGSVEKRRPDAALLPELSSTSPAVPPSSPPPGPNVSYAAVLKELADDFDGTKWQYTADALRHLATLVERITEAVATDERAMALTDPAARSSEQQYAEEEILSAAVSLAAGYSLPPNAAGFPPQEIG